MSAAMSRWEKQALTVYPVPCEICGTTIKTYIFWRDFQFRYAHDMFEDVYRMVACEQCYKYMINNKQCVGLYGDMYNIIYNNYMRTRRDKNQHV